MPIMYQEAFPVAQLVKNLPTMQETLVNSWVGKILWRRDRLPTPVFLSFPDGSAGKESACNVREIWVQSLGWEDPLEKGKYSLQYCDLKNSIHSMGRKESNMPEQLSHFTHTTE